jgi:uncharacterized phage protein gp47/JayE
MPWQTPTLKEVRSLVRDAIQGSLPGADALVPNSALRVISDVQGALCHETLQYVDWLSLQLLPDTAEAQWLDRHANIWLVNADGSTGRKMATLASGAVTFTGAAGALVPQGTQLSGPSSTGVTYETLADLTIPPGGGPAQVNARAIDPGKAGNLDPGSSLTVLGGVSGANTVATVVTMDGGTDEETDDELRLRVLDRIREPPMGGAANDYVQWALAVPGVTRAWCSPLEMGMGTVTVRFMCDDLRATSNPMTDGFPLPADITAVTTYLNKMRPVAVKDFFVVAPIPEPINFTVQGLHNDDADTRGAIVTSVTKMLKEKGAPAYSLNGVGQPAQTIYAAWVSEAIMETAGVEYFDLIMADHVMPTMGSLAVMGTVTFV